MSIRPIIDAGPGLNFLSVNKERLLIAVLGPLSAPETVRDEVFRKSRQDDRFRAAATVWRKLANHYIQILPDDVTPELATVVQRISGLPIAERMKHSKDLGETMVIAHAVVAAESGQSVTVLIDDGPGAAHPVILGGGKSPFAGVKEPRTLQLAQTGAGRNGRVVSMYRV
jgi:hypothetical protein